MKLLFERLSESELGKGDNVLHLRKSIMAEIARILSSRSYFAEFNAGSRHRRDFAGQIPGGRQTADILNYGIPRSSDFSGQNTADESYLTRSIAQAIRCGEPRLSQVDAVAETPKNPGDPLTVHVSGVIQCNEDQDWISFPFELYPG